MYCLCVLFVFVSDVLCCVLLCCVYCLLLSVVGFVFVLDFVCVLSCCYFV